MSQLKQKFSAAFAGVTSRVTGCLVSLLVAGTMTGELGSTLVTAQTSSTGAIWSMTNAATGNAVVSFVRAANGSLTPDGIVSTGGLGTGPGASGSGLDSQGSMALSKNGKFLYVVNGGSNNISVFSVQPQGLTLLGLTPSGGSRPISLTIHENSLYVLNSDPNVDCDNITGFKILADGLLSPLARSTRPLSTCHTDPRQVAFNPKGDLLVVVERATNLIDTYTVAENGRTAGPRKYPSAGQAPFAVAFGLKNQLVVADNFFDVNNQGAASSYITTSDGSLRLVSGPVFNSQSGTCWVVITNNGKYAYGINTDNDTITGYRISNDGTLLLLNPNGLTATVASGAQPRDVVLSQDSRYLYVLNSAVGTISSFQVNDDGSLRSIGTVDGIPSPGDNGITGF